MARRPCRDRGSRYWRKQLVAAVVLVLATATTAAELRAAGPGADGFAIGTGQVTGVYYPAGGAICQLVNRSADAPRCAVVPGDGSIANIDALRAGDIEFAIVQSDWQYWATQGAEFFAEPTPFAALNAVFALHAEPLVIAARRDSGIRTFDDLAGKRVGVGAPGTATRGLMEAALAGFGRTMADFGEPRELTAEAQAAALCDGGLDAAAFAAGSPSARLAALAERCDISLVAIDGPAVDELVRTRPYYRKTTIPAGIYRGIDAAVPTFGVGATLVTRADVADAAVTAVLRAVFADLAAFRAQHPALTWLTLPAMAQDGLVAPRHPAAARFFAERGGS